MIHNKLLGSLFIVAISLAIVSCGGKTSETTEVELPKVRISKVTLREVDQSSLFTATVEPEAKNNIAPITPSRIRTIFVEIGDNVKKGQRLAQMDAANLTNLETQLANIRENYRRVSELFSVGGASRQELDNTKLQLDMAETNLKNMQENTYLLSPINGLVTARNYDSGDLFNGQVPVLTVMQINPLKLLINISEKYYSQVKKGMIVNVTFDALAGKVYEGRVSLIYPVIDEATRTFAVEITLANGNYEIRPGMFARVNINFGTKERVVVADRSIVKQPGSGIRYVFIYKEGTVYYQEVTQGIRLGDEYEVLTGLNPGDVIVTAGQARITDGDKVEVIE
jgi:RND family efflux transporter MFP subunit